MRLTYLRFVFGFVLLSSLITSSFAAGNHMILKSKKASFDDIKSNVTEALTNRGLVINNTSHISDMLARTGKDLGGKKQIYQKAELLEFCSATVSRATMEADATNIVFCPYIIAIYVLPQDPQKVYVGFRRPQLVGSPASKKSLKEVEKLLNDIVAEALQ